MKGEKRRREEKNWVRGERRKGQKRAGNNKRQETRR